MTEYSFDRDDYYHDRRDDMPRWYDHSRDETMSNEYFMERNRDRVRDTDYEGQKSVGYIEATTRRLAFFTMAPMNSRRRKTIGLAWYFE